MDLNVHVTRRERTTEEGRGGDGEAAKKLKSRFGVIETVCTASDPILCAEVGVLQSHIRCYSEGVYCMVAFSIIETVYCMHKTALIIVGKKMSSSS